MHIFIASQATGQDAYHDHTLFIMDNADMQLIHQRINDSHQFSDS